jgi:hypothetical protein
MITVMIAMTMATMGRLIKNFGMARRYPVLGCYSAGEGMEAGALLSIGAVPLVEAGAVSGRGITVQPSVTF